MTSSPTDLIDDRDAGRIGDEQMVQQLIDLEYTYEQFPDRGLISVEALIRGTWNEVEEAYIQERLTRDQYARILDAHRGEIVAAAALDQKLTAVELRHADPATAALVSEMREALRTGGHSVDQVQRRLAGIDQGRDSAGEVTR